MISAKISQLSKKKVLRGLLISVVFFIAIVGLKYMNVESGSVALKPMNHESSSKKIWNDVFTNTSLTRDDGYIVVGYATDRDLDNSMCTDKYEEDAIIVKYDEKGELKWKKYLNGKDNEDYESVQETSDGGYIVAGYITGGGDHLKGKSEWYDAVIARYSDSGELLWNKKFGNLFMNEEFNDVKQTSDGGYIAVGGQRRGYNHFDALIVKYDKSGRMKWHKSLGGKGHDYFSTVQLTSDGGYISLGSTSMENNSSNSELNKDNQAIMVKYDNDGNIMWKNLFKTNGDGYYNSGKQTSDGGYILVGYCFSTKDESNFIVKCNEKGVEMWHKAFESSNHVSVSSVEETEDGGYMVVGNSNSKDGNRRQFNNVETNAIIMKYDKDGNLVERKDLENSSNSSFSYIKRTGLNQYMTIGYLWDNGEGYNVKHSRMFALKYDSLLKLGEPLIIRNTTAYSRDN